MRIEPQTLVVTGATGGLGRAAAIDFAKTGARVIVVGRDAARGAETVAQAQAAGGRADLVTGDVSTRAGVAAVAAAVLALTPRVDALINNAGGTFATAVATADGLETTFALNAFGPWLLTEALKPALVAARGRVVNVATGFLDWFPVDPDDLVAPESYSGNTQYGRVKNVVVMMTVEQARRLAPEVTVVSMHPGIILGTGFGGGQSALMQAVAGPVMRLVGLANTLEEAVRRFRVATFEPVPTGSYLVKGAPAPLPKSAADEAVRARVIALLDRLAAPAP